MALGGGSFTTQNKKLPGSYINFVSAVKASAALSERGIAAIPAVFSWGKEQEVITLANEEFQNKTLEILGYNLMHEKLKGLRDLFLNAKTVHLYRLNKGIKATCTYADALYSGTRGNDLKIVIKKNVDDETKFDVSTLLDTDIIDVQTVVGANELKDNSFVVFKKEATLEETAATPLTGGTDGETVTTTEYQGFLDSIESYAFNALGCPTEDAVINKLFVSFTKRMRDEVGAKFVTVVYRQSADFEGVKAVENEVSDTNKAALVYWATGAEAGCEVNRSLTNRAYDGEFDVDVKYTQAQLTEALEKGKFIFHNVTGEVRVLEDINTLTTFTDTKGIDFSSAQTIRVIDQIANDVAALFNTKYLGKIPNNNAGRVSLWNDVVSIYRTLETIQAIENFSTDTIKVEQGHSKKAVVLTQNGLNIVNAMAQLYMTVEIQ